MALNLPPKLSLVELKALLKPKETSAGLFFSHLNAQVAQGALTEWSGAAKTEALFCFLKEHTSKKVVWIEPQFTLYPPSMLQRGININNILFIETPCEFIWSCFQILKSQAFDILVLSLSRHLTEKCLRRLQIATEKTQMVFMLLCTEPHPTAWPIRHQYSWNFCEQPTKSFFDQRFFFSHAKQQLQRQRR